MDLIICSTPYQIFTAVNLKKAGILCEKCDLLIFNYFKGAIDIKKSICERKIFNNVYLANVKKVLNRCTTGKIRGFIWTSLYIINKKYFCKKIGLTHSYNRLFYSFVDPSVIVIERFLSLYNNVDTIAYEDGLKDYYNSQNEYRQRLLMRIFRIPEKVYCRDVVYLYYPELAPVTNGIYKIKRIPKLFLNEDNRFLLNSIFSYDNRCDIKEKIVYFDQLPHPRIGASDEFNQEVITVLCKYFGNNIIVKKHPRRNNSIYDIKSIRLFEKEGVPFEIVCLNYDCSEKIFITNISSACFMPKIIFDLEPTIVFTFFIEHSQSDKNVLAFLDRFVKTYRDQEKLFFPKSMSEFEDILKKIHDL